MNPDQLASLRPDGLDLHSFQVISWFSKVRVKMFLENATGCELILVLKGFHAIS